MRIPGVGMVFVLICNSASIAYYEEMWFNYTIYMVVLVEIKLGLAFSNQSALLRRLL